MELGKLIDRARQLEERAAALYGRCSAASVDDERAASFFRRIAEEEREHARSLVEARARLGAADAWRTHVEGWEEALRDVEGRLAAGESLSETATTADRLAAALEIELSELDELRSRLLSLTGNAGDSPIRAHAGHIAEEAVQLTDDPQVGLQAALLSARLRLIQPH